MPIDPSAVGAESGPVERSWTSKDALLYAVGVGAGSSELPFTTENSAGIDQQVLPTFAVIACSPFAAALQIGSFNFSLLLHGSQAIRLFKPLPPAGPLPRSPGGASCSAPPRSAAPPTFFAALTS